MKRIVLLLAALLLLQGCETLRNLCETPHFVLVNYGRLDTAKSNENCGVEADVITGRLLIYKGMYPYIVDREDMIKAEFGTDLSIEYTVTNYDKICDKEIKVVVTHPRMTNPATGKSSTVDSFTSRIDGANHNQSGWVLNHEWEVVKGPWTFQIYYHDEMLLEKTLTTY
jgi:hypothetical protein